MNFKTKIKNKLTIVFAVAIAFIAVTANAQKQLKALIVTTTNCWHHESLHEGMAALKEMANRNFFDAVLWQYPNGFTGNYLKQFGAVIFLTTTCNIFNPEQQKVFERFIQSGKGYVGIHSASDTKYDWEWYTKLAGRMFHIHPAFQTARLQVLDATLPGLQGWAATGKNNVSLKNVHD